MSKVRVEDPSEMLATGEKVYCKVISLEVRSSALNLQLKYMIILIDVVKTRFQFPESGAISSGIS